MNNKKLQRIIDEIFENQKIIQDNLIKLRSLFSEEKNDSDISNYPNIVDESKLASLIIGGPMNNSEFTEYFDDPDDVISDAEKFRRFAEKIITEKNKPLRIKTIHKEALKQKLNLPGRGEVSNLIVTFTRDPRDRFVKYAKGVYGLKKLNHPGRQVGINHPNITR